MSKEDGFTHLDEKGCARMVDVSDKPVTRREARARCRVLLGPEVFRALVEGEVPKGDVLAVARVAGVQAAKATAGLIPLCHPLPLDHAEVLFRTDPAGHLLEVEASVATTARTGAEMEAMTACAVAALTVYDMCKALSRQIRITGLQLVSKSGGRSGDFVAPDRP